MSVNSNDPEKKEIVTRRAAVLGGGFSLLLVGIGARLFQLQVVDHKKYQRLAEENQFNTRVITPLRGEIVDRFGVSLASNRQNFRVLFIPDETQEVELALDRIAEFVNITPEKRAKLLREIRRTKGFAPVEIENNLEWEQFSKVNYELPYLPGAHPEVGETRNYPLGNATAFVIGYVGAVTDRDLAAKENENQQLLLRQPGFKVGREGLERTYESELRGVAGTMDVKVNAHGRVIEEIEESTEAPTQGETLGLTIDADLQVAAMKVLEGQSASAVVIDTETGDILVLASTPAFDPNIFTKGIPNALWKELNESPYKPLLNKPLGGIYPPGSTFKMVSAVAAMRAGISPSFKIRCNGKFWYGNRFFHCWKKEGHGTVDMKNSLKLSCDTFYYTVATQLDIDLLADTARKFGLDQTFELGIPGQHSGVIPDRAWKKRYYRSSPENQTWFPGETLSAIIGQGSVSTTPLQLAVMAARLATGREVRPRIVRMKGDLLLPQAAAPKLDIPEEYLQVVRAGMNAVTNEPGGTAWRSRLEEPEWQIAGKTGTSQVFRITEEERRRGLTKPEDLPWARRDHALFVCYGPYDSPRYACAVVVEHGIGGARMAGPKAREIMRAVLQKDPAKLKPIGPEAIAGELDNAARG
ncbi:MAG: penicillin-binding protein 2 [Parvularculaceae bacterium]|nr:penicillin-binding protein 2 [Parvularculaceae bacterium]